VISTGSISGGALVELVETGRRRDLDKIDQRWCVGRACRAPGDGVISTGSISGGALVELVETRSTA
jgi:hypothetical protein